MVYKTDQNTLDIYATDRSGYRIVPQGVAYPEKEDDVLELIESAKKSGVPLVPRGAGSNLSGNAVGRGTIVVMTSMDRLISAGNGSAIIQPGIVYDKLNEQMEAEGWFLPYHVSSSPFCTVGGNVSTRASGLRSIKYGSVDNSLAALRFVSPAWGIIDTAEELPADLAAEMNRLKAQLVDDRYMMEVLEKKRNLKTSTGYNLYGLIDFEEPREMVTHLLVGSVGSLGILTRLNVKLHPIPKQRVMVAAFFDSIISAAGAVPELNKLEPSMLELMDGFGTGMVKQRADFPIPDQAGAVLLIEFDQDAEHYLTRVKDVLTHASLHHQVIYDGEEQKRLFTTRGQMLLEIKKKNETEDKKYLSFIDDLAVPVEHLSPFLLEIETFLKNEDVEAVIYGHAGEGNLHIRPLIQRDNWKEDMQRIGRKCFDAVFKFGGTVAAEHGAGRNRLWLIREEWGEEVFSLFREIKDLFDPSHIINPGVMFPEGDVAKYLEF